MQMSTEEMQEEFEERLSSVKQNLAKLNEKVKTRVTQTPLLCLAGAVLAGFVIGKLVSRR